MARLWVSDLALDRFREHWCPGYSVGAARQELRSLCERAIRTQDRSPGGQEIWRAGTGGEVRLVVQADRTHGRMPTIVTVLPRETASSLDLEDD
jgi:hypothetical protein